MSGIWDLIGGAGSIAGGIVAADDMRELGTSAANQMGELAGTLQADSQFNGFGVQTGLGTTTVGPDGSMNLGVGQDMGLAGMGMDNMNAANAGYGQANAGFNQANQGLGANSTMNGTTSGGLNAMGQSQQGLGGYQSGMLGASQQAMQNSMMNTGAREQEIYNRGMAMQQPGLDAARAQQQAREHAMGRGGVRGSQYGGSAEDAAMARAQAQAQNQMSFQSMTQAQSEMMNQANMANSYGSQGLAASNAQQTYGNSVAGIGQNQQQINQNAFSQMGNIAANQGNMATAQGQLGVAQDASSWNAMNQQLNALQMGQGNASMAQTGQLTGAGYASQLGMGGIEAQINANVAANNLFGDMMQGGMGMIGGIGDSGGVRNWWDALWD